MSRYISAKIALQIIDRYANSAEKDENTKSAIKAIRDIVEVICPNADVQEIKHGYWTEEWRECSVCGESLVDIMDADSSFSYFYEDGTEFCPFCGAKMDGKEDNNDL